MSEENKAIVRRQIEWTLLESNPGSKALGEGADEPRSQQCWLPLLLLTSVFHLAPAVTNRSVPARRWPPCRPTSRLRFRPPKFPWMRYPPATQPAHPTNRRQSLPGSLARPVRAGIPPAHRLVFPNLDNQKSFPRGDAKEVGNRLSRSRRIASQWPAFIYLANTSARRVRKK
jgi:hypothetical protein